MKTYHSIRSLGRVLMLTLGLCSLAAKADDFRYRYVSLDHLALPPGFAVFFSAAIQNSGRVYGTVCDDVCLDGNIAYYKDGIVTVLQPHGFAGVVNERGTVGGFVLTDPVNFVAQAALFRDKTELIPAQPGEVFSFVVALNDNDVAVVESDAASGQRTFLLYKNGHSTKLDFGPKYNGHVSFSGRCINNEGIIAGTEYIVGPFDDARGFRFDTRTGAATLLNPSPEDPTETLAWGLGINNRGNVLGYSFVAVAPYHERVGVWRGNGDFRTGIVETVSSNKLLFNDDNVIVITMLGSHNSYLVPKPGIRLNLADLVTNAPAGQNFTSIFDMNNRADLIGFGSKGDFLLRRVEAGESEAVATATTTSQVGSAVTNAPSNMPPAIAAMLSRYTQRSRVLK